MRTAEKREFTSGRVADRQGGPILGHRCGGRRRGGRRNSQTRCDGPPPSRGWHSPIPTQFDCLPPLVVRNTNLRTGPPFSHGPTEWPITIVPSTSSQPVTEEPNFRQHLQWGPGRLFAPEKLESRLCRRRWGDARTGRTPTHPMVWPSAPLSLCRGSTRDGYLNTAPDGAYGCSCRSRISHCGCTGKCSPRNDC